MKGGRGSEYFIVPWNQGNRTRWDPGEERRYLIVEPLEGNRPGAPDPDPLSTRQQRIAELAQQAPEMGFTSLAHHSDL